MNIFVRTGKRQRSFFTATPFTVQESFARPRAPGVIPALRAKRTAPQAFLATKVWKRQTVTATTPPRIASVGPAPRARRTAPLSTVIQVVFPRTPNSPHLPPRTKCIIPTPIGRWIAPRVISLITRRDKGNGPSSPVPVIILQPPRHQKPGWVKTISSPGTPYPFTRARIVEAARRLVPALRQPISLRTPFYPRLPIRTPNIFGPAPRAVRLKAFVSWLGSRSIAGPFLPHSVVIGRPRGHGRPGGIVIGRTIGRSEVPPRPLVFLPRRASLLPPRAITARSTRFTQTPRPAQSIIRPPIIGKTPPRSATLQVSRGGQAGPMPLPRVLSVARAPEARRPAKPVITRASFLSPAQLPVRRPTVTAMGRPPFRKPQMISLRVQPATPRGAGPMPRAMFIVAAKTGKKPVVQPIQVSTPRTGTGIPVDLPDAVATWLINQPTFVTAFGYSAQNQCISADWDDPGGVYPYLVYREPDSDRDYESQGGYEEDSQFIMAVVSDSKELSRDLGEIVGVIMNDAPLEFLHGSVYYFRWRNPGFPPTKEAGKQANTWVWRRVLRFDYKVEGRLPF